MSDVADNLRRLATALDEPGARIDGVDGDLLEVDLTDPDDLAARANWTLHTARGLRPFVAR